MMRWDLMLDTAEVTRKIVETIIDIIGRKTSQEYAAITIQNILRRLQLKYPFLHGIEIKNSRSLELESSVSVNDSLNTIAPKDVGLALKDLITKIIKSLGKTAGYFFIRETREKIGIEYDKILLKEMNVDLTLLQSTIIVENKSINVLEIQKSDVLRRFLKTLLEAVEKQSSKAFAFSLLQQLLTRVQQDYPFLHSVAVNDIRYTLGSDEIIVNLEINNVESRTLGNAISVILQETDKIVLDMGRNSIAEDIKTHLTIEYLSKLSEMGVSIVSQGIGFTALFSEVIKTSINIMSKTSSESNVIFIVNSLLRNIETKYDFIKDITVESSTNKNDVYKIVFQDGIDKISETDARRAIQHFLESIIESLGEKTGNEFLQEFKSVIDKKYLNKMEEIGVNFHMIELHETMLNKT
jgi:hypothetical protein